jgi:Ca2+:H+ antiporter
MHSLTPLLNQTWFIALMAAALIGSVLSAVHHAEVIAHKTG